ncbi:hypothetical protein MTR67_051758 [Solanum verrucosum]|uniref:Uncharacterized protein n=1 Tax=Solanum verrucosum TaxID=315347 RepID=A0AAF0V3X1_SOLVR|nr:hypothetical protein MTR67_051758 [Solanum verrucosum]
MSVHYHPGKENVVAYALSRLSMGSVTHVEEERKELAKDGHILARLGVLLMRILDSGVIVQNGSESSSVAEVKEKQDNDPILLQLTGKVPRQKAKPKPRGQGCPTLASYCPRGSRPVILTTGQQLSPRPVGLTTDCGRSRGLPLSSREVAKLGRVTGQGTTGTTTGRGSLDGLWCDPRK